MEPKIKFSIKDLDELKKLLVLAEEQTKQLDETINKIKEFKLVIKS
ncbi:hypothetical protein [Levilactobacillus angrenensis]|uniref:Uncharacterized protein n=1 Tax=Levilactobacillus angrenensis TaxID=2486020 RepID=A0ABW1UD72_9LACO|nr:hypothetical protein [Levilactobacillus angrenensis]